MAKRIMYDFSAIHLGEAGIASFALKPDAIAFAKSRGWLAGDVRRAYNRFCMFWIVGQQAGHDGALRVLTRGGIAEVHAPMELAR